MRVFPKRAWLVVLGLVLVMAVSAAGQTSGEGLFGKWFVATPDLAKNKP